VQINTAPLSLSLMQEGVL